MYFILNSALREQNRDGVKPWRHYIWLLLNGLRKLPPVSSDTVYRGMKLALSDLGPNYTRGCEFQWAGFSSTTSHIEVLETFLGTSGPRVIFHLRLTESVARDISPFSLFPKEMEVVLPPNMLFVVKSVLNAGHGLHQVQCEQTDTVDMLINF